MKYGDLKVGSFGLCLAFITTTAWGMGQQYPSPGGQASPVQEKFKVVIQKAPGSLTNHDFSYVFCLVNSPTETIYANTKVSAKKILAKRTAPKILSTGFTRLLEGTTLSSVIGTSLLPSNNNQYVRLLVSKDWHALTAQRKGVATSMQYNTIAISQPINLVTLCAAPNTDKVAAVAGRVVFTITEDAAEQPSGLKITVKDERKCKITNKSKIAKAKDATGSAYSRAKTKAKSAWSSTKNAASSAKTKVGNAATSAKNKLSSAASSAKDSWNKKFGNK